jgi:hypothetical protein
MTTTDWIVIAEAPMWQSVLAFVGFFGIVVGVLVLQRWSQRRRRRGEEASTYNAQGAEAPLFRPPRT